MSAGKFVKYQLKLIRCMKVKAFQYNIDVDLQSVIILICVHQLMLVSRCIFKIIDSSDTFTLLLKLIMNECYYLLLPVLVKPCRIDD